MKVIIQRKVEVWVEDIYNVEEINENIIDQAINYDIDADDTETLYDTLVDLGPVEVYDENWNLLRKNYSDE